MGIKKEIDENDYKKILLEVLLEIDDFCTEKNIKYYLIAGTLIGAVRHKGFIPWDDDIDIVMLREDYEKFFKEYTSKSGRYQIVNIDCNKDYYLPFGKIYDTRTVLKEDYKHVIEIGAYVDIFPLDYAGDDYEQAKKLYHHVDIYNEILKTKLTPVSNKRTFFRNIIAGISSVLPVSVENIIRKMDSLSQKYNGEKATKFIAPFVSMPYGERQILKAEWFDQTINVEFEGHLFPAPKCYHEILTSFYGDYMQLPPPEMRISRHSFDVYYK